MTAWFYLTFGFALFFILLGKEEGFKSRPWRRALELSLGLTLVLTIDRLTGYLLWNPSGREDLRLISIFFWVLLINQWTLWEKPKEKTRIEILPGPAFVALLGFSLWTVGKGAELSLGQQFIYGLSMPLGSAVIEWFLTGLRGRAKLSLIPAVLEGEPVLFWLAMLLFFAFAGFRWLGISAGVG